MKGAGACALCAILAACSPPADRAQGPLEAAPVDAARVRLEEAGQWRHQRTPASDLNGDGAVERIVLTADVTPNDAGAPLWEDGHRRALFVEEGEQRTLAHGAFVPNGHTAPDRAVAAAPHGAMSRGGTSSAAAVPENAR